MPEHVHAPTVVELPNGELLAAWFQGSGERWADDVRIMGARRVQPATSAAAWSRPFVMADVPGFPDINPVLFLDPRQQLWLLWYTVLANQWDSSLLKYRISDDYLQPDGAPRWKWQDVLHVKPGSSTERGIQADDSFVAAVASQQQQLEQELKRARVSAEQLAEWNEFRDVILARARGEELPREGRDLSSADQHSLPLGYPHLRRLGWQTKNKPLFVGNRMLLPLYSDYLEMSLVAFTDDFGAHWQFSRPLVGMANVQPTLARRADGTLVAYMRDNGPPPYRHPVSLSHDNGLTWSPVTDSELVNGGSGSDLAALRNGHWVMVFNDVEDGRYSLVAALSTDEGRSWSARRQLEQDLRTPDDRRTSFAYPAAIQGADETIHVVYSVQHKDGLGNTIKHVAFRESWLLESN